MDGIAIILALESHGYAVTAAAGLDGAIRAFQRDRGLGVDGIVGRETERALRTEPPRAPDGRRPPLDGMAALVTDAALRRFEPFSRADIRAAITGNVPALVEAGLVTPLRLAHFLAQVAHESGGLARTEEYLRYTADRLTAVWPSRFPTRASALPYANDPQALAERVYGGRLGNVRPGDGWRFRGSAGLGTTGRDNFGQAGFADDPDALRLPENFLAPALLYWRTRGCNALADRDDIEGVTRRINGGVIGLADRAKRLAVAKRVFIA